MILMVMGVSGSSKSTVGLLLAERLGWPFVEADDFHSRQAREKMSAGLGLGDEERWPWLERVGAAILQKGEFCVCACSALKASYRHFLEQRLPYPLRWIFLDGPESVLAARLQQRQGHFAKSSLLRSQLRDLEPPASAWVFPIAHSPERITDGILSALTRMRNE